MPPQQHMNNPNAKRILIVCDEGNNRSITIAGQLKYWGHDCLCVGLNRNRPVTIGTLAITWADLVIFTADDQLQHFLADYDEDELEFTKSEILFPTLLRGSFNKVTYQVWDIGEDKYPRPYNKELLALVKKHIEEHRDELAPTKRKEQ